MSSSERWNRACLWRWRSDRRGPGSVHCGRERHGVAAAVALLFLFLHRMEPRPTTITFHCDAQPGHCTAPHSNCSSEAPAVRPRCSNSLWNGSARAETRLDTLHCITVRRIAARCCMRGRKTYAGSRAGERLTARPRAPRGTGTRHHQLMVDGHPSNICYGVIR